MTILTCDDDSICNDSNLLKLYKPHKKAVYSIAVSNNKKKIISASIDSTAKIFDIISGELEHILKGHEEEVYFVAIDNQDQRVATCSEDGTIRIWKFETGNLLRIIESHSGAVFSVKFSPNGRYIVSTSEDKTVRIIDWNTKKSIKILRGHDFSVRSSTITPDGKFIATSGKNTIKIWRWGSGKLINTLSHHQFSVRTISSDRKGKFIISGSLDKSVVLWDFETGKVIKQFSDSKGVINSVAISDDSKFIAAAAGDSYVYIWNLESGELINQFRHIGGVQSVRFIPNTHLVVSGDLKGYVYIWDVNNECLSLEKGLQTEECEEDLESVSRKITIFISYATIDSEHFKIAEIARLLQRNYDEIEAVLYWEEDMDDDIFEYMNDNLAISDVIMVFCSKNSAKSDAVRAEWMAAYKMKKKIIPVFEHEEDIPPLLTTKLGVNYQGEDSKEFAQKLYEIVKKKTKSLLENNG